MHFLKISIVKSVYMIGFCFVSITPIHQSTTSDGMIARGMRISIEKKSIVLQNKQLVNSEAIWFMCMNGENGACRGYCWCLKVGKAMACV